MANGIVTTRNASGGVIQCTDSTTGGAATIPFLTEDLRYGGSPSVGDVVTYSRGVDNGRLVAKAISVSS